jgi:hypothetical protein
MKFKETNIGDRLTVWHLNQRCYVLKINADAAVILSSGEILHIHKNKEIEYAEHLSPDQPLGVYQHEVVACRRLDAQHYATSRLMIIGGGIVKKGEVKIMASKKKDLSQVYIIMNVFEKKLQQLQALMETLKVLVEEATEDGSPRTNYIMSTSEPVPPLELPGE